MRAMRSSEPDSTPRIEYLSSDNYTEWSIAIKAAPRFKEELEWIESDKWHTIHAKENLTDDEKRIMCKGDEKALGIIQLNCSKTYMHMISSCTTSLDAWERLREHF